MVEGSEDCLLVDVFTPKLGYDTPLPVVVYIGGETMGGDYHRWATLGQQSWVNIILVGNYYFG